MSLTSNLSGLRDQRLGKSEVPIGFEMTRYFSLLTLPESRLNDLVSYRRLFTSLWLNSRCPWCGMLMGSGGKDSFNFIRKSLAERSPFVNLIFVKGDPKRRG